MSVNIPLPDLPDMVINIKFQFWYSNGHTCFGQFLDFVHCSTRIKEAVGFMAQLSAE